MPIYYTYLIGWSQLNKWYYGVQFNNKSNPKDLWLTYFTSSKYVSQFKLAHGDPDVIQVRQCFDSVTKARKFEFKVLSRLNVRDSDKWLNRSNGAKDFGCNSTHRKGAKMSPETIKRISESNKGKKRSDHTKHLISKNHVGMTGKQWSNTQKSKLATTYKITYLNGAEKIIIGLREFCRDVLNTSVQLFSYHRDHNNLSKYGIMCIEEYLK